MIPKTNPSSGYRVIKTARRICMAIGEIELEALRKFKTMLKEGISISEAKMKSRIYALAHQDRLSPDAEFIVNELSEKYRMAKHLVPKQNS
jgi:hypothetical protein